MIAFLVVNAKYVSTHRGEKVNKTEVPQEQVATTKNDTRSGPMKITTDFEHMGQIPSIYTCDGQDTAPIIHISDVPTNTQELALIVDDPDAPMGTWVHWVVYNIPANTTTIDNNNLPSEAKLGITDFGRFGWGGPCPPNGQHRYFFKLYALDKKLELSIGAKKSELETAMQGHIIEQAEIVGLYKRIK